MEEISIPEIPYELTCYNLDCEVPLAFPFNEFFPCSETSVKLEELPSGLVFPDNLRNKIRYDANKKLLIFKRVMSKEIKDRLLTLSADGSYKQAVEDFFYFSRFTEITIENIEKCSDFFAEGWKRTHLIKRHLHLLKLVSIVHPGDFYEELETSECLEKLPEDIPKPPKCGDEDEIVLLDNQDIFVSYYAGGYLYCSGIMGEAEKEELLNLSQDALYQEAIKKLQKSPEEFINEQRALFKGELERIADFLLLTLRLLKSSRIWMKHVYGFIYSDFLSTNIPLKPYKLKNGDIELIYELYERTGYFLSAGREYLKGEQRKKQGVSRGYFITALALSKITEIKHNSSSSNKISTRASSEITEIKHNIDLALSYYMRAHDEPLYREDLSLIQLFIALEALFVQEGDEQNIKYRLSNRVATLLGEDQNRHKRIQEILKKLYELRGDIVHGSEIPNPDITHDLLQELFEYVRLSILYFIGLATREKKDIINTLDMTLRWDDTNIRKLREEIWGYYPSELRKVLQFNAE